MRRGHDSNVFGKSSQQDCWYLGSRYERRETAGKDSTGLVCGPGVTESSFPTWGEHLGMETQDLHLGLAGLHRSVRLHKGSQVDFKAALHFKGKRPWEKNPGRLEGKDGNQSPEPR